MCDIRWRQRYENYSKAIFQLGEFLELESLNKFEKQGLVQCFEYTFELAWKTINDYLDSEGITQVTPRKCIQSAFQLGLISNGHLWIDALEKRNLMAHTYDEDRTEKVITLITGSYAPLLIEFHIDMGKK